MINFIVNGNFSGMLLSLPTLFKKTDLNKS